MESFPILDRQIGNHRLVYLDNAATTQKPVRVISAISNFYQKHNANIHRGLHTLSNESTAMVEETRRKIQKLINASSEKEIVHTYGTTHGINTIAYAWGDENLKKGDEVVVSIMEHHANIVPWQELSNRKGVVLKYVPLSKDQDFDYTAYKKLVTKKTKLVSILQTSNVLGAVIDVQKITKIAKAVNARVHIDAAQSIAHQEIDVQKLGIDFLTFSGHKMYGPTGVGALYVSKNVANEMGVFITGGDMILSVEKDKTVYQEPPQRFEAGTINIADIVGLGAAIDFLMDTGLTTIKEKETDLVQYLYRQLKNFPGATVYGPENRCSVVSFTLDNVHPHDIAEIVNRYGVAIRSGNHCAMPLHRELGLVATARASVAYYNTREDIDVLITALKEAQRIFE